MVTAGIFLAWGVAGPAVGAGPLVTPTPPVADRLVPDSRPVEPAQPAEPAPVVAPPPVESRPLVDPVADPAADVAADPRRASGVVLTVLAVLTVIAVVLGVASLSERLAPPSSRRRPQAPVWESSPAALLHTGPDTVLPSGARVPAVAATGLAVVPVLARPGAGAGTWTEVHDLVDTWAWHEYWLPTGRAAGAVLPADGLVLGDGVALDTDEVRWGPGLVAPFPGSEPVVLPVSAGLILSRPAATSAAQLRPWLAREVRALRAASQQRTGAALAFVHTLTGPLWAVGLPVAAVVAGVGPWLLALTTAPLGVGVVTAALRWAAMDDADRSTTLRLPVRRGALLIATGPVHALLRMREAWSALAAPPPVTMRRRVAIAVGRRPAVRPPGRRPAPWTSTGRA